MHAILIEADKSLAWKEVPDPQCGAGEVIIKIKAAALNRADVLQREGQYPPPPGWPEWMGLECAGVVETAAPGSRWHPGDKVCALLGGGGYAEKVKVPEGMVMPVPAGLSFAEAAALPEAFATSYLNLFIEAKLKPEETIFIPAGASGLGIAAIQLAKSFGAKVITTISNDAKAEAVRKLGADIIVNRKTDDLLAVFDANPVHVAMDCAGGEMLGKCFEKMAIGGRWIMIATLGGVSTTINLRALLKRGIMLKGSTLRSRTNEMKTEILAQLVRDVWPKIESGALRPLVFATFPMQQAEAAHEILNAQKNIGKVVLTLD